MPNPSKTRKTQSSGEDSEHGPEWTPNHLDKTDDLSTNGLENADIETLGANRDALFIMYRGWEWSFKLQSEHPQSPEIRDKQVDDFPSVEWDVSPDGIELGGEAAFVSGVANDGTEMQRSYVLQDVHPQNPDARAVYRHSEMNEGDLVTDGGTVTIPADNAFNPVQLRFTRADGETFEMEVVDSDIVDEDAYVNGRYGGRSQPLTLEGEYDGPQGEGTYVLHAKVTQEKRSDNAEVSLWIPAPFCEIDGEKPIELDSVEVDHVE